MTPSDQNTYRELMRDVRRRTDVMNILLADPSRAVYNWTWVEFLSLQLRMILETIALGCLVANQSDWPRSPSDLQKAWNAGIILSELENIQPECFPVPLIEIPPGSEARSIDTAGRYRGELLPRPPGDWLTRVEFTELYGRLGTILHARNPLGQSPEYQYYQDNIPVWYNKIIKLLNRHRISIRESNRMYVVQMNASPDGGPDGDVQVTEFVRMNP